MRNILETIISWVNIQIVHVLIERLALATGSRTITSDRTVYNNSSFSFSFELVGEISLDRNYEEVNSLFVLSGLRLNILRTEEMLQFGTKKFSVRLILIFTRF